MTTTAPPVPATAPRRGLSVPQGAALTLGAVLGTGVISLPGLAAEAAGPASLVAWLGLVVLSVPLAATFAALGARHPDGGGRLDLRPARVRRPGVDDGRLELLPHDPRRRAGRVRLRRRLRRRRHRGAAGRPRSRPRRPWSSR
ncbi:hypothetical protein [Nocardioides sp. TF02-7]|uniref:hypothetical protein n=1 Tax=Nocardioides sp. TF02-7 TaxID=2917724 RepID=UPI001F05C34A|nr:hypothetical protein [Nocardioides sp. TF02-7]UMG91435.1 hypothetical protein MF408_14975 [Nocardioides sp. TF02-7]